MRVPSNLSRGSLGFNMTPMIDVVFLLIIFFLVSSHLARQEVQMEMDLPEATTGQDTQEEDETWRVVVNVLPEDRPEGQLMVGGRRMQAGQFAHLIAYEYQREKEKQKRDPPLMEVRIRTDRKVPYRAVEPVMVACAQSKIWKVTFAVVGD